MEKLQLYGSPMFVYTAKKCWTNLRAVFDPFVKPWINMQGATTEQIITQVNQCPSGALSIENNQEHS